MLRVVRPKLVRGIKGRIGSVAALRGRGVEALPNYERISGWLERYPAMMPEVGSDFHVWYGAALEAKGRPDEALVQYRRALEQRPDWIVPLRNIGQTLMQQGKCDEAVGIYRRALEVDASFAIGYVNLGLCLSRLSRKNEALAVLEAFRQAAPESAENAAAPNTVAMARPPGSAESHSLAARNSPFVRSA